MAGIITDLSRALGEITEAGVGVGAGGSSNTSMKNQAQEDKSGFLRHEIKEDMNSPPKPPSPLNNNNKGGTKGIVCEKNNNNKGGTKGIVCEMCKTPISNLTTSSSGSSSKDQRKDTSLSALHSNSSSIGSMVIWSKLQSKIQVRPTVLLSTTISPILSLIPYTL